MGTATRAMAVGKNKRLTKGKKGSKKKAIDPFTKKDWYDVKAPALFTNFWGMSFTTDKLRSLVRKWQSLIEAHCDVKTTDNYLLRVFCIGFTKRRQFQIRKTSYAQSAQIRAIRKKMVDIMTKEVSSVELIKAVEKFVPEYIGKDIQKACEGTYPLQNVFIRKVKILKAPKFDAAKLAEIHSGDTGADTGAKIARNADAEATAQAAAAEPTAN